MFPWPVIMVVKFCVRCIFACSRRKVTEHDSVNTDHSDGMERERWRNGNVTCSVNRPLYCHLWPAPLYHIFPHGLIIGTIFGKNRLLNIRCVLSFSTSLKYFSFLTVIQRDIIINVRGSSCEVPVILVKFELEFARQILGKILKFQISWHFV